MSGIHGKKVPGCYIDSLSLFWKLILKHLYRFCHIEFESKTAALQAEKEIKETHKEVVVRYLAEARDFDSHKPSKTQSQKSKSLQLNASKHKKKAKSNTHTPDPETTSGECVSSLKQEDIQHKKSPQKKKGKKPVDSIEKIEKAKTNVMDEKQGTKNSNVNDSLEPTTWYTIVFIFKIIFGNILEFILFNLC